METTSRKVAHVREAKRRADVERDGRSMVADLYRQVSAEERVTTASLQGRPKRCDLVCLLSTV